MTETAAILAGGLGTRLRPAVADRPKALAPVAGRPFITYLLDQLEADFVRRVVLLTGYRGDQVRQELGERYGRLTLAYSPEPSPLGTGGALRAALPMIDSPTVLALNGDSYCGVDLAAFAASHRRRGAGASLVLTRVDDAGRYGRVETGRGGRVTAFAEKRAGGGPGWVNAGVYRIERRLLEAAPAGRPASLERDWLPAWVAAGEVCGCGSAAPFLDIGTPETYAAAAAFFLGLSAVRRRRVRTTITP
jgi:NDP-sugar pyrophosphorylase family protein